MNELFKQMEDAFEDKIQDGVNKLQSGDLKSVAAISRKIVVRDLRRTLYGNGHRKVKGGVGYYLHPL